MSDESDSRQITVRASGTAVRVDVPAQERTPLEARELAAELLRAANEAEGVQPSQAVFSARQHVRDTWVAGNGPEAFSAALDVLELAVREDTRTA